MSNQRFWVIRTHMGAPRTTASARRQHRRPRWSARNHCCRLVLGAIFYVVRVGVAWRQLPSEVPSATTVYAIFARGSVRVCGGGFATRCVIAPVCGAAAIC